MKSNTVREQTDKPSAQELCISSLIHQFRHLFHQLDCAALNYSKQVVCIALLPADSTISTVLFGNKKVLLCTPNMSTKAACLKLILN